MAKVRVHELAKELGVESKVVLAKLKEMGEFVKSASSTVEPPVVKRFSEKFGDELSPPTRPQRAGRPRQAGSQGPRGAGEDACPGEPRPPLPRPRRAGSLRVRPGRRGPGHVVGSRPGPRRPAPAKPAEAPAPEVPAASAPQPAAPEVEAPAASAAAPEAPAAAETPAAGPHRVDPSSRPAPGPALRPSRRRWRRCRQWPSRVPATGQQPVRALAGHGSPSGAPSGRDPDAAPADPSAASAGRA